MAYGLRTRASIENTPVVQVRMADPSGFSEHSWHALSEACRLEVVEQALRAANDRIDGYPLAL